MQSLKPPKRANSGIDHFEFGRLVLQTLSEQRPPGHPSLFDGSPEREFTEDLFPDAGR
jgi:hypothetical protein